MGTAPLARSDWAFRPDPYSTRVYYLLAVEACLGIALFEAFGFHLDSIVLVAPPAWSALFVLAGWMLRRVGHDRLGGAAEALGVFGLAVALTFGLALVALAIGAPLADARLAAADHAIGFNWLAFALWTKPIHWPLHYIYETMFVQQVTLIPLMFFFHRGERAWRMIAAFMLCGLFATAIASFVPAVGACQYFGCAAHGIQEWGRFDQAVNSARVGGRVVDLSTVKGIICFPSLHTAAATVLAWGAWRTPLRWPLALLNGLMILSAIVIGAHYLVDILGGSIVAAPSIWIAKRFATRPITVLRT